jgi:acetylornithine deacetylase
MIDPTIRLLSDLVATDSVNPALAPGGAGEENIARLIAAEMRSIGMQVELTEVAPHRPNVLGVLEGKAPGCSLMFCGHMDTVGVGGMAAPFTPLVREGRLYGRGSQDMKGGVAAMLGAARQLASSGGLPAGTLIVAAVADEEHASLGAQEVVRRWRADGAVITEPTDFEIALAHRGFSWVEVETRGIAAHGSKPREGRDAIFRMGKVLNRLAKLDGELQATPPHAIQGAASLHASLISGGQELSRYPDNCLLQFERRTTSAEPDGVALREIHDILRTLKEEDEEFDASAELILERSAFEIPSEHALPRLLRAAMIRVGRMPREGGVTFWTDAAILARAGIPTVIFGPGGAGLHGREEFVYVADVLACRDVLAELARVFCAGKATLDAS